MGNQVLTLFRRVLFLTAFVMILLTTQQVFAQSPLSQDEGVIFDSVNEARSQAGLPSLKRSDRLNALATIRAQEISQSFSHVRPNGEGYNSLDPQVMHGENIVFGTRLSGIDDQSMWMNSQGHRENILTVGYSYIGIGSYFDGSNHYFVQIFSKFNMEDTAVEAPVRSEVLEETTGDEQSETVPQHKDDAISKDREEEEKRAFVTQTLHKEKSLVHYYYRNQKLEATKVLYANQIQLVSSRLYR